MQPLALTAKRSRNKYGHGRGELMLVHLRTDCGDFSINRIAADDDAHTLLEVFNASITLPFWTLDLLLEDEIEILPPEGLAVLQLQLFGQAAKSV
jgi:hypothetical protein